MRISSSPNQLQESLNALSHQAFLGGKIGLEKESLRVNESGLISSKNHPTLLGSPLTHPYITTDYAEALLELITPPCDSSAQSLAFLADIETFVYHHLEDEKLWTTSMPCTLQSEEDIRIAQYGESNVGQMKNIYRRGLGLRYGKLMQVIAGVHFNFSFSEQLWSERFQLQFGRGSKSSAELRAYKDQSYMDMIRNIQRYGWLLIYLFGASPAICKSFIKGLPEKLPEPLKKFDEQSYYAPYATSLRMGDIGYTNSKEGKTGIQIVYNSLPEYLSSMRQAIGTPCPNYEKLGVLKEGQYQQLNANILQIENEHYSTIRPKQLLKAMEKPVDALESRGIEYIELRSLDINPYYATGLSLQQMHFIEIFMHFCLLKPSPPITQNEAMQLNYNQYLVANAGRKPGLKLQKANAIVALSDYALSLMDDLDVVAQTLDTSHKTKNYSQSLARHRLMIEEPRLTPSAKILLEMKEQNESFMDFSLRKSCQHRDVYLATKLEEQNIQDFSMLSQHSLYEQQLFEANDSLSLDEFLKAYFVN